ncbi:hypothetical protein ACFL5V_05060 [Fibrobacterota bacterium]
MYWGNPDAEDKSNHDLVFNKANGFILVLHQEHKVKGRFHFHHKPWENNWHKFKPKKHEHVIKFIENLGRNSKVSPALFNKLLPLNGHAPKCSHKNGKHHGHKCKICPAFTFSWWSFSHHSGRNYYAYVLEGGKLSYYKNGEKEYAKHCKPKHVELIDEVRISNIARSSEWIKFNYENQKEEQVLVELPY